MDKFIQLPFTIPQCERSGIEGYVRLLLPHEKADSTGASSTTEVPKPLEENDQVPSNPRDVRVLAYSACARALNSVSSTVRALFTRRTNGDKFGGTLSDGSNQDKSQAGSTIDRLDEAETEEVRKVMLALSADFSTNPREIKRLLNMVRFCLLLRKHRQDKGGGVPTLDQYQRWIFLSLRWPDMMRWLQWGSDQLLERGRSANIGIVSRRLSLLEAQASKAADLTTWRKEAAAALGLQEDGV